MKIPSFLKTWICIIPGSMLLAFTYPADSLETISWHIAIIIVLFGGGSIRENWKD
jgi:hypothetical protein